MNEFEKKWIDGATYKELLIKIRFEPVGSSWLVGETGHYLMSRYHQLRQELPLGMHAKISKEIGW